MAKPVWSVVSAIKFKLGWSNQRLFNFALQTFKELGDRVTPDDISRGRLSRLKEKLTIDQYRQLAKRLEMVKQGKGL
ncbi:MAG: hypothetical protein IAE90_07350 [Ignavibacteria bacterium]|nr:hypothetical protein [Ignavibacteria bacterium]